MMGGSETKRKQILYFFSVIIRGRGKLLRRGLGGVDLSDPGLHAACDVGGGEALLQEDGGGHGRASARAADDGDGLGGVELRHPVGELAEGNVDDALQGGLGDFGIFADVEELRGVGGCEGFGQLLDGDGGDGLHGSYAFIGGVDLQEVPWIVRDCAGAVISTKNGIFGEIIRLARRLRIKCVLVPYPSLNLKDEFFGDGEGGVDGAFGFEEDFRHEGIAVFGVDSGFGEAVGTDAHACHAAAFGELVD